jgi:hypothetical protein
VPDPQNAQQILEALALTGATTVVAAMATDAWQATRAGTARLFRHGGPAREEAAAALLEADAALVARAANAQRARLALIPRWQLELEELLRDRGDAASEVQALVREVRSLLPRMQETWVQNNIARDHGQVFASLGGNVIVHQGPAEPAGADSSAADQEDEGQA